MARITDRLYPLLAAVDTALATMPDGRVRRWRSVTKPGLMPLLLPRAAGDPRRTGALVASWIGDVALLNADAPARFVAGAGSFGVAHLAYLATFPHLRRWADPRTWDAAAWTTVAAAGVATPVVANAVRRTDVPVAAVVGYAGVLTSMTLAALADRTSLHGRQRALGAALFLASDTALGVRTFVVTDENSPAARVLGGVVMGTYTAAQALLNPAPQTSRPFAAASESRRTWRRLA